MLKSTAAVAAVRGGSGAQTCLKSLPVSPLRSTALKAGQQAGAVYGPRPNPAALAAPGSQSQAPRSFPSSPSPPRPPPQAGAPRLTASPAGLAGPHPANPRQRRRQAAPPSRVPDKTRFRQEKGAETRR
ncbi:conserved hypothetical protein [Photorhabdus asymbiotica]|uniref:Uncharacterized protein n=1 Tax=Photorhabdus asymbiotica subsp. asymbiotica (strain ATCC 43949 / 3105-77) TaxID=553480 RepID=C7BNP0_PHOAA|nr:conserved hypothetical protein [Photorhabdus asymbiotica]CAQ85092.1 conserved hypothetical protein [Photorhabdus asymbiotica]CAR67448.1 Hypothetical Protein PA-RVA14-1072 [Photorhabdus asymbiotica subsp. asymbiotica ATCC 43949]